MGKRLVKKAKTVAKGFKYGKKLLNPGTWIDVALDIATDALVGQVEQMFEGEEGGVEGEIGVEIGNETSYVNNYYVTNRNVVNNITPPTFPPRFNSRTPRFYRHNPIAIPPRILPTEVDNQRDFVSPVGQSINVGVQTTLDKSEYGKLIFNPLSTNKTLLKRKPLNDKGKFLNSYQKAQKEAIQAIDKQKNEEPLPVQYTGYLICTESLTGLRGDGKVLMGINTISTLAQTYRALSSFAYIEPSNEIPVAYQDLDVNTTLTDLKFNGTAVPVAKNSDLWDLLGYKDEETFEKKSIEDVIKEFGKKQYEVTSKSLGEALKNLTIGGKPQEVKQPTISELGITNLEQFAVHAFASLFYRNGFHRFPATVPESLIFDDEKYKNPKDQPTKKLDDALEVQEYLLRNLDALCGQFPINFVYKFKNSEGKEDKKKIKIPNIGEALTEIIGMALNIQTNCDASVVIGLKNLVETVKATNSAIVAGDYAKANAKYLGYKSEEIDKEVPISFTPNKTDLKEILKESKQKIITVKNSDNDTLVEDVKNILIAAQIIKSALVQPFNGENGFLTGDTIRDLKKEYQEKWNTEWDDLIKYYNDPNNARKPFKKAKLKDRSIPPKPII